MAETSKALVWDEAGNRFYETGVKNCALYVMSDDGSYPKGVAWNGVTAISEKPSGAESTPLYADDIKYLNLTSVEEFAATIEAYYSPEEFDACDGTAQLVTGAMIGQQPRKTFGLAYKTTIGNDIEGTDYGYKIHIIYGAKAQPSERAYQSINDSPEAMTLSWELTTTPVNVTGAKPTASVTIDSTKVNETKLAALEKVLFGDTTTDARLPLPDEIKTLLTA